jgi:pyruvate dehydrogenase E2 component (dihydrolipoamide acetyltransferase)
LVKQSDKIKEGDILAEIETDKTMEFESFNEGTLLYIGIQEEMQHLLTAYLS